MMGHSWRCLYRIMRMKIRWGCDRGDENEQIELESQLVRCEEAEMLGGADAKRWRCNEVHYMRMRPHEVQARWMIWTSSTTEGAGAFLA